MQVGTNKMLGGARQSVSGGRRFTGAGERQSPGAGKWEKSAWEAQDAASRLRRCSCSCSAAEGGVGGSFLLLVLPVHNQCKRREVGWICHCAVLCKHGGELCTMICGSTESLWRSTTSLTLMNCVYNYCCTMTWNPIMVSRHSSWHAMVLRHIA